MTLGHRFAGSHLVNVMASQSNPASVFPLRVHVHIHVVSAASTESIGLVLSFIKSMLCLGPFPVNYWLTISGSGKLLLHN